MPTVEPNQTSHHGEITISVSAKPTRRDRRKGYRCVASSPEGLVQQLAVSYLRHGYWFYVSGRLKPGKDPAELDRKLIAKYGIDISERAKS